MRSEEEIAELKHKLAEHEKRIKSLENMILGRKAEEITLVKGKVDFERLAEKIGVKSEKVRELFDIENNSLTLLKVMGKDERDKTKKISLVVLLGYKYASGNEQVLSKEIRRNVAENRTSVNNFATYLNEMTPSLIRRIGKPKSPKITYKLTALGEAEAKEILKKLCK